MKEKSTPIWHWKEQDIGKSKCSILDLTSQPWENYFLLVSVNTFVKKKWQLGCITSKILSRPAVPNPLIQFFMLLLLNHNFAAVMKNNVNIFGDRCLSRCLHPQIKNC